MALFSGHGNNYTLHRTGETNSNPSIQPTFMNLPDICQHCRYCQNNCLNDDAGQFTWEFQAKKRIQTVNFQEIPGSDQLNLQQHERHKKQILPASLTLKIFQKLDLIPVKQNFLVVLQLLKQPRDDDPRSSEFISYLVV